MKTKITSFKELMVWQKSMILAEHIYKFSQLLPQEEKYGLVSQLRRCAVSIPSNIAEGKEQSTKKNFLRFLKIAQGSSAELETQVLLAVKVYPQLQNPESIHELILEVRKMLSVLIKKLTEY